MGETMAYTDEIMILGKCSGEKIGKNKNSIEYSKAKKETAQQTRRYILFILQKKSKRGRVKKWQKERNLMLRRNILKSKE